MFKTASALLAVVLSAGLSVRAQTPAAQSNASGGTKKADKASSYYHYALAHMYAELAGAYGNRGGYLDKAIENFKAAIKADPDTPQLTEELAELYVGSGRLREAQSDAEDTLRQNPNDLAARRLLARVFTSQIGDQERKRIDEAMLGKAIEQYQKITTIDPKDADSYVMLGRLQKLAQNSNAAEQSYKKALEIDPGNEDALTGLAILYSDLGDTSRAAETLGKLKNPSVKSLRALAGTYEQMKEYALAAQALQRALETNPPDAADLKHALAEDQSHAKQYDAALRTLQDLVSEEPGDFQAYLEMSRVYREMKDLPKAHAMSDKAKALEPDNLDVRFNEVGILQAEGKVQDSIRAMKDLLAATQKRNYNPDERRLRSQLLDELAQMYAGVDQIDSAVDTYHQAIDLDPSLAPGMTARIINVYRAGKDLPKAEQEADAAMKKWPNDDAVVGAHALVLADSGKTDAAAAEVKKLANGKNDLRVDLTLVELYDKGHKFSDEAKVLDAAEKLSTSNDEKITVWFQRGAMFEKSKNIEAAEAEFRKILKLDPDNAGALNYLGFMLADRGMKLTEALEMITKALDSEPNNGAYLDSLGWVYFKLGKLPEAEENLRRALEYTPRDATVRDHMGDVLMRESKVREAVAQWEISLKEWNASSPADLEPAEVAKVKAKLDGAKVRLAKENGKQY